MTGRGQCLGRPRPDRVPETDSPDGRMPGDRPFPPHVGMCAGEKSRLRLDVERPPPRFGRVRLHALVLLLMLKRSSIMKT